MPQPDFFPEPLDAPSAGDERPTIDGQPHGGLPRAPSGRVPAWVVDEAARAQVAGTRPNFGPFVESPPAGTGIRYLGGSGDPAGHYVAPGQYRPGDAEGTPRRSLGARLAGIGVAVAVALAAVFVSADALRTSRVPPELLGSYAERTDLPAPLGLTPARGRPTAGFGEQDRRLAPSPEVTKQSDAWVYRDTATEHGRDLPVLWSPCRPIHYVVSTADAPDDFLVHVTAAVEEVSAATGLVFRYDGTTQEAIAAGRDPFLPLLYGDRWAPVLIGWSDDERIADLEENVAGLAYTHAAWDPTHGAVHSVSGQIVLDLDLRTFARRDAYVGVLRHELGHLVGLGHIEDESQIMHASSNVSRFQAGDLTGLAAVGQGTCAPGI